MPAGRLESGTRTANAPKGSQRDPSRRLREDDNWGQLPRLYRTVSDQTLHSHDLADTVPFRGLAPKPRPSLPAGGPRCAYQPAWNLAHSGHRHSVATKRVRERNAADDRGILIA